MADLIVIAILVFITVFVIRKLYKDYKKYGTCAGCAEAQLSRTLNDKETIAELVGHQTFDDVGSAIR